MPALSSLFSPCPLDGLDPTSEPQLAAAFERRLRAHCDSPPQGDDVTPAVDEPGPRGRRGRWPAHSPGAPRERRRPCSMASSAPFGTRAAGRAPFFDFRVADGKIVSIEIVADPARLGELELEVLSWISQAPPRMRVRPTSSYSLQSRASGLRSHLRGGP